jgi:hypothetical protein
MKIMVIFYSSEKCKTNFGDHIFQYLSSGMFVATLICSVNCVPSKRIALVSALLNC